MPNLTTQLERSLRVGEIEKDGQVQAALIAHARGWQAGIWVKERRALIDAILTANRNIELAENVPK